MFSAVSGSVLLGHWLLFCQFLRQIMTYRIPQRQSPGESCLLCVTVTSWSLPRHSEVLWLVTVKAAATRGNPRFRELFAQPHPAFALLCCSPLLIFLSTLRWGHWLVGDKMISRWLKKKKKRLSRHLQVDNRIAGIPSPVTSEPHSQRTLLLMMLFRLGRVDPARMVFGIFMNYIGLKQ